MSVVRSFQLEQAFAFHKQPALGTALSVANINKKTPYRAFVPTVPENAAVISDGAWYGKGHSFATFFDPIQRRYVLGSREYSLSSLTALFAPAFVMGAVATSQPDSAGAPTVYDHKFTFKDPGTDPNCVVTSFLEKVGAEGQFLYSGVALNQFTLNGQRDDHVTLAWDGYARKKASDASSLPALSTVSFFKTLFATFSFGTYGAPATVSTEVLSFNFTAAQDPQWMWLPGATAGEENLCSKILIGRQQVSGQLRTFMDAARLALFENSTECELNIVCVGPTISGAFKHQVTIRIPHFQLANIGVTEEGSTIALELNFTEESVLKPSNNQDYASVTVRSNDNGSTILVNG